LCRITDLNPLPFYKFCESCKFVEIFETEEKIYSCHDYNGKEKCPKCFSNDLTMEGHNLPFETFFGWEGEKTPDIDLNFSGEYQKGVHNYVRNLIGRDSVFRIGTISTLSQQTSEIFWKEHLKLREKLNSKENFEELMGKATFDFQKDFYKKKGENSLGFREEEWCRSWIDNSKIKKMDDRMFQARTEKKMLERKLKDLEENLGKE
jgi:DNA polymerase III alpha subunit (gram-positive type)